MSKSPKIRQKTCLFNCNFYTELETTRADRDPWTLQDINRRKKIVHSNDFESSDLFIFPVNIQRSHWLLVVLDKENKEVQIYDSGGQPPITRIKSTFEKFFKVRLI